MPRTNEPIRTIMAGGKTRYRVIVDAGMVNGKRKQVCGTFDTKREAKSFLARTKADVDAGRYIVRSRDTLADQVKAWLVAKEGTVRPATLYDYGSGIRPYLEALGDRPVQSITRADVEAVVAAQVAAGKAQRTVSYNLGLLRQVLDRAVEDGLVPRNVAHRVAAKGQPAATGEAFTQAEIASIAAHITGDPLEHAFTLTLLGLRRSEVLGLTWADIDLKAGTLSVAHTRVEKTKTIGAPKTERGRRTLPLDPGLIALLGEAKRAQGAIAGYVVVDAAGKPIRPERYSDLWRDMLRDAGVRDLDLRAARRGSVTAMRDRGIPDHIVAAWHGHDERVMKSHYSVAHEERLREAAQSLAKIRQAG